jgi:hypothetical protein
MMNNEEFNRTMEFLVNQLAQFDANMQELREAQKTNDQKVARFKDDLTDTRETLAQTTEIVAQTTENLAHLITITHAGFKFTFENSKNIDAKIDALVDSQIRTDEIIRNIGAKLDRHINEDHSSA